MVDVRPIDSRAGHQFRITVLAAFRSPSSPEQLAEPGTCQEPRDDLPMLVVDL
jgi:hypothetical protein